MPQLSRLPAPVTLRDVAAAAGVHVSTVSRALDPKRRGNVSTDVLEQVTLAARRLGYRPNLAASSLRTGRTHMIGVLVAGLQDPALLPVLRDIESACSSRGFLMIVASSSGGETRSTVEHLVGQQVDGVVLVTLPDEALREAVMRAGIPVAAVEGASPGAGARAAELLFSVLEASRA